MPPLGQMKLVLLNLNYKPLIYRSIIIAIFYSLSSNR